MTGDPVLPGFRLIRARAKERGQSTAAAAAVVSSDVSRLKSCLIFSVHVKTHWLTVGIPSSKKLQAFVVKRCFFSHGWRATASGQRAR